MQQDPSKISPIKEIYDLARKNKVDLGKQMKIKDRLAFV